MPVISAERTPGEILKDIEDGVKDRDEIFDGINPQDPKYLEKLKRDFENWKANGQGEDETIIHFLDWRLTQGS